MNWFALHPKVKAAVIAVVLVAVGAVTAALNGSETWNAAALQVGTAALATLAAYLKSA